MKKKVMAMVLAIGLIFSLGACANNSGETTNKEADTSKTEQKADANASSPDSQKQPEQLQKLTISHHPSTHGLPAYVALEKGWFKEQGLDVDLMVYISGPPQMEALASNAWETGGAGGPGAVNGVVSYDLSILGYGTWDDPSLDIYVREDSPIYKSGKGNIPNYPDIYGKPEDWKGKEFLLPKGTTAHLTLLATLEAMGLSEEDVKITHMEVPAAYTAFKANQGDGVVQWITFSLNAQKNGWKKVSGAEAAGVHIPTCVFASSKILKDRPEVVQKYLDTYMEAAMWINDNPEDAAEYFLEYCTENGVKTSLEDCKKLLEMHKTPTVAEVEKMLQPSNGDMNEYKQVMSDMMDYFIKMGNYTEEQKEKVLEYMDDTYMMKTVEFLKNNKK
ncbi:NrtA/SsuA/CpmA family ABC transporter substrate-binding protein [Petroclostridium sp. X23]|uniref:ABC transporter substrate-binding protein n=1 Tax=Petroclostridium sp. X23 TaxID=3045146 RepID=UPI0024ADBC1E|nr:NrtA/SsuA/CpmA family ABC transporter substrate-binding protein [Petroclostridium sp. X23]WHH60825.1 NrtA/SsuA/CpmA family ABC transporter substrate-binding protein [Petroclostridium sp. X23]